LDDLLNQTRTKENAMEILKNPLKTWGRFFEMLPLGSGNHSTKKSTGSTGRISLSMENEVQGNWVCTHTQPLASVLRRTRS
jgi:hypothetical protein